jgi:hypothetical protein
MMNIVELLQDKILKLKMNNQQPAYVYVGELEYHELRALAHRVVSISEIKDEFMGIELVRVYRNNHINVTAS